MFPLRERAMSPRHAGAEPGPRSLPFEANEWRRARHLMLNECFPLSQERVRSCGCGVCSDPSEISKQQNLTLFQSISKQYLNINLLMLYMGSMPTLSP